MVNIAIVEDEKTNHDNIKKLLLKYADDKSYTFCIDDFYTGKEIITDYKPKYDIIFLDIQMPELDGITAAEKIRETDKDVMIVFITSLAQYALLGYKVQAYDYIVKPVPYKTISFTLDRIMQILEKRPKGKSMMIQTDNATIKIPIADITYIEVSRHTFLCHTMENSYPFKATSMKDIEKEFAEYNFTRCNNCYLVNLKHVNSVQKDMVEVGNDMLTISRPRKKAFLQELFDFIENT